MTATDHDRMVERLLQVTNDDSLKWERSADSTLMATVGELRVYLIALPPIGGGEAMLHVSYDGLRHEVQVPAAVYEAIAAQRRRVTDELPRRLLTELDSLWAGGRF